MMRIRIENVQLYTGETCCQDACVLVESGRIAFAGDARQCGDPHADQVIDGKSALCMPGLWNAHTHAAMTLVRGLGSDLRLMDWLDQVCPMEARMDGDAVYWGTRLAMLEMLRRGVVGFADMYFHMPRVAEAVIESGMKASLTRGCSDASGVDSVVSLHGDYHGAADGRVRVPMGLHAEYTSDEDIARYAIEKAHALGSGFHTHIAETAFEVRGCMERHGVSPVRYFHDLGALRLGAIAAHCVHVTGEDIELLRQDNVHVAHCPASNMKLASGFAPVTKLLDAGVSVALGTDGASSNNGLDLLSDMRLASLLQKGFTGDPTALNARQAIRMATRAGAQALGFPDSGLVAEGMKADLILLSGDAENLMPQHDLLANIAFSASGLNTRLTMVDGRILYQDGQFRTLDEGQIKAEFQKAAARLMR